MTHCEYCGTGLSEEDPDIEDATGERHYTARCREYVFQVKQHAKSEAANLRTALAQAAADMQALKDRTQADMIAQGEEIARLRVALAFYADKEKHIARKGFPCPAWIDGGEIARAALATMPDQGGGT